MLDHSGARCIRYVNLARPKPGIEPVKLVDVAGDRFLQGFTTAAPRPY